MALRRWLIGMLCLPLLGVAGCSDDETSSDPDPTSTPSVTAPSPTESKTPDEPIEPEPPAAMDGTGAKAAKAFVRYYWAMVSYAQVTGDTLELRELGFDLCELCSGAIEDIEQIYNDGGHINGGAFLVREVQPTQLQRGEHSTYSVDFTLHAEKQVVLQKKGGKRQRRDGGDTKLRFLIGHDSEGDWRVSQWEFPS